MQTQITVRHVDADPAVRSHASERLARLQRYYDGITDARVVVGVDGTGAENKSAEIVLRVYRQTLSATGSGTSHEEAIDRCTDALRRQLKKYKAKLRDTHKEYMK